MVNMPTEINEIRQKHPIILLSLDGWGVGPLSAANIFDAKIAPNIHGLLEKYPCARLSTKASLFGYPDNEITTSKLGHLMIGSGAYVGIGKSSTIHDVDSGKFFKDHYLLEAVKQVKQYNSSWHLIGLVDDNGVFEDIDYLTALLDYANRKKISQVYLHIVFSQSDQALCQAILKKISSLVESFDGNVIASLIGSDYALNQAYQWDKTEEVYGHLLGQHTNVAKNPHKVIKKASERGRLGRQMKPIACQIDNHDTTSIKENDVVIFFNHETAPFYQLASALTEFGFDKFNRVSVSGVIYLSMAKFPECLNIKTIGHKVAHPNLSSVISKNGLKQLIITESLGALSACYYGSGMAERPTADEHWQIINSPLSTDIINTPECSSELIINQAIKLISSANYDLIRITIPALNLSGRVGGSNLMIRCLVVLDELIVRLVKESLDNDCLLLVTSSCSGSESAIDLLSGEDAYINSNKEVPLVVIGNHLEGCSLDRLDASGGDLNLLKLGGSILDIAPTIIKQFGLEQPKSMIGKSLL